MAGLQALHSFHKEVANINNLGNLLSPLQVQFAGALEHVGEVRHPDLPLPVSRYATQGLDQARASKSFGQVTAIANAPRDIQFGLKIGF
jgi:hypothetical protein